VILGNVLPGRPADMGLSGETPVSSVSDLNDRFARLDRDA